MTNAQRQAETRPIVMKARARRHTTAWTENPALEHLRRIKESIAVQRENAHHLWTINQTLREIARLS